MRTRLNVNVVEDLRDMKVLARKNTKELDDGLYHMSIKSIISDGHASYLFLDKSGIELVLSVFEFYYPCINAYIEQVCRRKS